MYTRAPPPPSKNVIMRYGIHLWASSLPALSKREEWHPQFCTSQTIRILRREDGPSPNQHSGNMAAREGDHPSLDQILVAVEHDEIWSLSGKRIPHSMIIIIIIMYIEETLADDKDQAPQGHYLLRRLSIGMQIEGKWGVISWNWLWKVPVLIWHQKYRPARLKTGFSVLVHYSFFDQSLRHNIWNEITKKTKAIIVLISHCIVCYVNAMIPLACQYVKFSWHHQDTPATYFGLPRSFVPRELLLQHMKMHIVTEDTRQVHSTLPPATHTYTSLLFPPSLASDQNSAVQ